MAQIPVGLSDAAITAILAQLRANGEINNVPQPRLDDILADARENLELKQQGPIIPPPPPPPRPPAPRAPGAPEPVVLVIRQPT